MLDLCGVRRAERGDNRLTWIGTDPPLKANKFQLTGFTSITTHTNIAVALTEVAAVTQRLHVDLTNREFSRISGWVIVAGNAGCKMHLQYTPIAAPQTAFADLIPKATGLDIATASSTVLQVGSWVAIPAAAQVPVIIRLVSVDGDGAADPQTRGIEMHYK